MLKPLIRKPVPGFSFPCSGCPDGFDNAEQNDEAPPDFATINNAAQLYKGSKPITGQGQTVVVLEISDIQAADAATFRSAFGPFSYSGAFSQIHPGPGRTNPGKNGEKVKLLLTPGGRAQSLPMPTSN
jgi:hypothetical protein